LVAGVVGNSEPGGAGVIGVLSSKESLALWPALQVVEPSIAIAVGPKTTTCRVRVQWGK
jgi:hypothetical protein